MVASRTHPFQNDDLADKIFDYQYLCSIGIHCRWHYELRDDVDNYDGAAADDDDYGDGVDYGDDDDDDDYGDDDEDDDNDEGDDGDYVVVIVVVIVMFLLWLLLSSLLLLALLMSLLSYWHCYDQYHYYQCHIYVENIYHPYLIINLIMVITIQRVYIYT